MDINFLKLPHKLNIDIASFPGNDGVCLLKTFVREISGLVVPEVKSQTFDSTAIKSFDDLRSCSASKIVPYLHTARHLTIRFTTNNKGGKTSLLLK